MDHASYDLNELEIAQSCADCGAEFAREYRKRVRDEEYRRDALARVLADREEVALPVWALMHGSAEEHAAARRELGRLVNREIEEALDLELARRANADDEADGAWFRRAA